MKKIHTLVLSMSVIAILAVGAVIAFGHPGGDLVEGGFAGHPNEVFAGHPNESLAGHPDNDLSAGHPEDEVAGHPNEFSI